MDDHRILTDFTFHRFPVEVWRSDEIAISVCGPRTSRYNGVAVYIVLSILYSS